MINRLCKEIVTWREGKGFETSWRNVPEKLMLIVTEVSEAMEAFRRIKISDVNETWTRIGVSDQKSEEYLENFREELADTAIRLFDLCGSLGIDLEQEITKKMVINGQRAHKHGKEC